MENKTILERALLSFFKSKVEKAEKEGKKKKAFFLTILGIIIQLIILGFGIFILSILLFFRDDASLFIHEKFILNYEKALPIILTNKEIIPNSINQTFSYKLGYNFKREWINFKINVSFSPEINCNVTYSRQIDIYNKGNIFEEQHIYIEYPSLDIPEHKILIRVYCSDDEKLCGEETIDYNK